MKKGITIQITFTNGQEEEFKNITEIHYLYPTPMGKRIAFESDIEGTGFTYDISEIKEFEAKI